MLDTPDRLLDRAKMQADPQAWRRLVDLYTPLIRKWLGRYRLQPADLDDLVQDVLSVVVRELPDFQHNGRPGAFRHWLRVIAIHRLRRFWRAARAKKLVPLDLEFLAELERLEDPASDLSRLWDDEHDQHVVRRLLELIEPEFQPATWQAFRRVMLDGVSAVMVAAELGITPNAVWIAKSRILSRLRQEAEGLID